MNGRDGLFIGFAQALALIPGVSRSGATISAGLFRSFDRAAAARYSFLLSVPGGRPQRPLRAPRHRRRGRRLGRRHPRRHVAAFVSGYAAIAWLLRYLANHTRSTIFVAYRIPLGILVIASPRRGAIS